MSVCVCVSDLVRIMRRSIKACRVRAMSPPAISVDVRWLLAGGGEIFLVFLLAATTIPGSTFPIPCKACVSVCACVWLAVSGWVGGGDRGRGSYRPGQEGPQERVKS